MFIKCFKAIVEILQGGKSVVKQVVCGNCGVTLEYVPQDEMEAKHAYYDGSIETYKYIDCLKCGLNVEIKGY